MGRENGRKPEGRTWLVGGLWLMVATVASAADSLHLRQGARVAIVGNGLAEGMARHGYLETALRAAFPDGKITVRSFGREGFRVDEMGKGEIEAITRFGPDLIFLCTGWNEALDGVGQLPPFEAALREVLREFGKSRSLLRKGPRIELVPPLPYLPPFPGMPDEARTNAVLEPFAETLRRVAEEAAGTGFVDVWPGYPDLVSEAGGRVTPDGVRLNRRGHWLLAMVVARHLDLPGGGGPDDPVQAEVLRELVCRREAVWRESGRMAGERAWAGDERIWASPKPSVDSLWATVPPPGERMSNPTEGPAMPIPDLPEGADPPGRAAPSEAWAGMAAAPGWTVDGWASERTSGMWNPVALRFDAAGRAWIGCDPPGAVPFLLVLEDIDGDHRADRQRVFASGDLHPEGFLPAPGGAYVSTAEGIAWYADSDEDGVAETREIVLGGRGRRSGFRWDTGGGLWFREEPAEPGWVEMPRERGRTGSGGMIRWNPRVGRREVMLPWVAGGGGELVLDDWDAPARPVGMALRGIDGIALGREDGAGPAAGPGGVFALLGGNRWPSAFRGKGVAALRSGTGHWQVALRAARWEGSLRHWIRAETGTLLSSRDDRFYPVGIEHGPDGALHVLDAHGKNGQLQAGHWGRIWRLAPAGRSPDWVVPAAELDTDSLVRKLGEPGPAVRIELWNRPAGEVFPALGARLKTLGPDAGESETVHLEALRLHQAFGLVNPDLLGRVVASPLPWARRHATEVLAEWHGELPDAERTRWLALLVEDEHPRVGLAGLHAVRRTGVAEPSGLRAKALASSTADLTGTEWSSVAASVLMERPDVEAATLQRAAALLSARSGESVEAWIVARLEDRLCSRDLARNLEILLPGAAGWELQRHAARLEAIVEGDERPGIRRCAFAALAVAAAGTGRFERLRTSVETGGDHLVAEFLEACSAVARQPEVRAALFPALRDELAGEEDERPVRGQRVRVVAPGWERLHFAEVEVFSGDAQVALGRPASQSGAPDGARWWSSLSNNGTNGIKRWEEEFPLKDMDPGSTPVRGVMVAGSADGSVNPAWEVDLGGEFAVDRILYHPGAPLPLPGVLRFELLDGAGNPVWTTNRATAHRDPVQVVLPGGPARSASALALARFLGDEFRLSLETLARRPGFLPARFDAYRTMRRLGAVPADLRMRIVTGSYRDEGFDPPSVAVGAGEPVELELRNETGREVVLFLSREEIPPDEGDASGEVGEPGSAGVRRTEAVRLGSLPAVGRGRLPFLTPAEPGNHRIGPAEEDHPASGDQPGLIILVEAPVPGEGR